MMLLVKKIGNKMWENQLAKVMEIFPNFIPTLETKILIFKS
ncbi:hypothetical protein SAMN05660477_03144 [Soonwooa buanensis]|uniref:Uncharacterized protein n=1 Tax=Soonwooa buanensis TaxID=619805 RepID=A0A1T5GU71_9FLAO|nr:hypothetical protein SAMN05660477_03144 [Soonwooa buanensis]